MALSVRSANSDRTTYLSETVGVDSTLRVLEVTAMSVATHTSKKRVVLTIDTLQSCPNLKVLQATARPN